jgi:hypothetical protein
LEGEGALAALAMSACERPAESVHLVINKRQIMDGAVYACPPSEKPTCQGAGQGFAQTLSTRFAVLPACAGLVAATLDYFDEEGMRKFPGGPNPYWLLSVDFVPGARTQTWGLALIDAARQGQPLFKGEGDVSQIATEACNIVRGRGGAVAN